MDDISPVKSPRKVSAGVPKQSRNLKFASRLASSSLLKNCQRPFFRGFRQKPADAKTAKAHILYPLYAGAEAPAS